MSERPDELEIAMQVAETVAQRSHDAETKVGAVLIKQDGGSIIATGYNGFVRGAPDNKLPNKRPLKYSYVIHGEENVILHCAKHGISMKDCILVCTHSPCVHCMRLLWQAGIKEVYCKTRYRDFEAIQQMEDIEVSVEQNEGNGLWKIKYSTKQL